MDNKELFRKYDYNAPEFSLNNIKTYARVVSIHDGDTITLIIPFLDNYYKFHCRLNNLDTCEMTSKNDKIKEFAIKAKNLIINLITDKVLTINQTKKQINTDLSNDVYLIWINCYNFDKYGRLLIDAYKTDKDNITFSEILINEKLAYRYGGKKKLTEEEQLQLLCL